MSELSDTAMLVTAFSGLTVEIGALLTSVGVFVLAMKVGSAIESMVGDDKE